MPDLTQLPPWAAVLFIVTLAIVVAVIRSGILEGKNRPPSVRSNAAEVVALAIDSRALDKVAGELAGISIAMGESRAVLRALVDATGEQAKKTGELNDELGEVRRVVQGLNNQIEISREVSKARP